MKRIGNLVTQEAILIRKKFRTQRSAGGGGGIWGGNERLWRGPRRGREVLGEEETVPSFVSFTPRPSEGLCLGWRRNGAQHHLPVASCPTMTRALLAAGPQGSRAQEGPAQEEGSVHPRPDWLLGLSLGVWTAGVEGFARCYGEYLPAWGLDCGRPGGGEGGALGAAFKRPHSQLRPCLCRGLRLSAPLRFAPWASC